MTERWAPFSPPDEFGVADGKWMPACVLALRGGRGGVPGGQDGADGNQCAKNTSAY